MNKKLINLSIFIFSAIILNAICISCIIKQINVSDSIYRLHITANSNSEEDQIEKLKISCKVEKYINDITKNITSKKQINNIIGKNIANIYKLDDNISCINIGKINYTERENKFSYFPAGSYDSVNIIIGEGKGKNFWTLVSPLEEENVKDGAFNIFNIPEENVHYESLILNTLNFFNNMDKIKKN